MIYINLMIIDIFTSNRKPLKILDTLTQNWIMILNFKIIFLQFIGLIFKILKKS